MALKIKPKQEPEEESEEEEPKPAPKPKQVFLVVKDLPTQPVRQAQLEDGSIGTIISVEEAMTEMVNILKKLEKNLL